MKNKYAKRARISAAKIREVVHYFSHRFVRDPGGSTEREPQYVNRLYRALPTCRPVKRAAAFGVVEVDESFFGAAPREGPGGRLARATSRPREIVSDCSKPTPWALARVDAPPSSTPMAGYNGLVDLGYGHVRVDHGKDEFTKGTVHINGIEGFWGLAKVRLAKFKGLPRHTFHLHLKETEWRYNHRQTNKYQTLLQYLRENPLS